MARLERISHDRFRRAMPGRTRHGSCETLLRHCHQEPFVTLVLSGCYVEAGDTGCHRLQPGDVIWHQAYESHLDRFEVRGADVWVIELPGRWSGGLFGSVADADEIVRVGEGSAADAFKLLAECFVPASAPEGDWPEQLARDLRSDPSLSLSQWASGRGLHASSLSRGFSQMFGTTPASYRATQRAIQALEAVRATNTPLSQIAAQCNFADQAHMSRAIAALTGSSPAAVRRHSAGFAFPG